MVNGRKVRKGSRILIINMNGEPDYCGREGVVTHIDDAGQLHGTWGGCALIPGEDEFTVISKYAEDEEL